MNPRFVSIDVLIPVLARPQNAQPVVDGLEDSGASWWRAIFLCSPGDEAQKEACERTGALTLVVTWEPGSGDYARKINAGFRASLAEYVFLGADDLEFTPGWDIAAVSALEASGAGVCGTQDGGNPQVKKGLHSTHSLVRRAYIEECGGTWDDGPGVVLHEGYQHQYVDTELVEVAKERGCWVFAHDSVVKHHHPMWDRTVARDATYEKALSGHAEDLALFRARKAAAR